MSRRTIFWLAGAGVLGLACSAWSLGLGDFENNLDGWRAENATTAFSPTGATLGKSSLKITSGSGWVNAISYDLLTRNQSEDFRNNKLLLVDVTRLGSEWVTAAGGYSQLFWVINAGGDGWSLWDMCAETCNWSPADGDQPKTFVIDYTSGLSKVQWNSVWWLQIFVCANWGGYSPGGTFYIDNVRMVSELLPSTATDPVPGSGRTDVPRDTVLSWRPGIYAKTHDVYFGASAADVRAADVNNPRGVLVSQGQTGLTYDPGLLEWGRTYTWRVDEINAPETPGLHKGDIWSFTVEPYAYRLTPIKATASSSMAATMGPEKTIDGSGLDAQDQHGVSASTMWTSKKGLSPVWIQYEFDDVYKLYQMWVWNSNQATEQIIGFGAKDVVVETSTDGTTWKTVAGVPEFAQGTGEPNYVHNTTVDLGGALAKYVKLAIANNWADGTKQASLSEVRFFHLPLRARGPEPASGAADVALDATLNWRPGREAAKHQVFIGVDPNTVLQGTAPASTVVQHSLDLAPLGLELNRTYAWKVNEVNDTSVPASWEGPLWTFTTVAYSVVDDFESYDDTCNRIFFSWVDGFGHSGSTDCGVPSSSGNGTGSTVGNVSPPFAEGTLVHSGKQSMPLWFDNTKAPFYSETRREWQTGQNWTLGGANTLTVWLRGDAAAFAETSPGTIIMNGIGTDIWGSGDQCRFAYRQLKGNGTILAKVESVANTNGWAKAGVMIRESIDAGSTHAMVVVTPANGVSFQRRALSGDVSTGTDTPGLAAPYWVKVTRNGSTFTAQRSPDGVTWSDITVSPAITIPMASDVLIGLVVTSHAANVVCSAKFSNVSTTGSVSGQWQTAEIGAAQVNGNTPETFYLALEDGAGQSKAVSNPDKTAIATGAWQQWDVSLSQFTAAGVDLGAIKKMVIGVGDRVAPKAGGTGKLYIDDVRLTRSAAP
jgi:hypothetical protein